jgi:hypothetical protein
MRTICSSINYLSKTVPKVNPNQENRIRPNSALELRKTNCQKFLSFINHITTLTKPSKRNFLLSLDLKEAE